ncbi:MAG TPA: class I SAM-dependent methyltransferase [Candidatus Sulfopaludibacter sp.]|nr:class I SAM-dependent methyltransferase [Candidatus Sulfopaludibacter sp.]
MSEPASVISPGERAALAERLRPVTPESVYTCPICDSAASWCCALDFAISGNDHFTGYRNFGDTGLLIHYFQCQDCAFLFAPSFWDFTDQDFARFIYNGDYLLADPPFREERPLRDAATLTILLAGRPVRLLDYGSGDGTLVRQMRAQGLNDAAAYDPIYDPTPPQGRFDVITCLEVIEHVNRQHELASTLRALLSPGGVVVISTQVQPPDFAELKERWWYIEPRNGHLAIHSERSLHRLFADHGLAVKQLCQDLYLVHEAGATPAWLAARVSDPLFLSRLCNDRNPIPEAI